jgi:hypothetical protein
MDQTTSATNQQARVLEVVNWLLTEYDPEGALYALRQGEPIQWLGLRWTSQNDVQIIKEARKRLRGML